MKQLGFGRDIGSESDVLIRLVEGVTTAGLGVFAIQLLTTESVPPKFSGEVARRWVATKFGKVLKFHDFRFRC